MWRKIRPHLPVIAGYAGLAILMTWPLVRHIAAAYPSADAWYGGDPNMYIWYGDWLAKTLTGAMPIAADKMMNYPQGINPYGGYEGLLMTAVLVPVILIGHNPVLAYNIFILLCFLAAAGAAYALCFRLTRSRLAAGIGGFIFGFSPYMMVRALQHPNLIMIATVPLLALAALAFAERPTPAGAARLAGAVILNALSSWYYHVGGLVFLAFVAVFHHRELVKRPRTALFGGLAALAAAALPALPMLLSPTHGGRSYDLDFIRNLGAQPLNFILPHPLTNVFGGLTAGWYNSFPSVYWSGPNIFEAVAYAGPLLLGLAVAALWLRASVKAPLLSFWATVSVVFAVLALGVDVGLGPWRLPLPFALLRGLFPFSLVRGPGRFFVFALLGLTVLAAFTLARLRSTVKNRFYRAAGLTVLLALLAAERIILPYPLFTARVSEFYREAGRDRAAYAIADLPLTYPGLSEYDYFQTVHGKPIVTGEFFYPAYSDDTLAFIARNGLLLQSVCRQDAPDEVVLPDRGTALKEMAGIGVRFIVVHHLVLHNTPLCDYPRRLLQKFFAGDKPYFADGEITVYEVSALLRPPAER